jgi:hypothetical protein
LSRAIAIPLIVAVRWAKAAALTLAFILSLATCYAVMAGSLMAFMHFTGLAYMPVSDDYDSDPDRLWW